MDSAFMDIILSISPKSLTVHITSSIYIQCLTLPPPPNSGLPAHASDIQVGDIIMEVESTDVTRANGDLVVSIVRYAHTAYDSYNLKAQVH